MVNVIITENRKYLEIFLVLSFLNICQTARAKMPNLKKNYDDSNDSKILFANNDLNTK